MMGHVGIIILSWMMEVIYNNFVYAENLKNTKRNRTTIKMEAMLPRLHQNMYVLYTFWTYRLSCF